MNKKDVEKLIVTADFARRVKRTVSAVTKSVRAGNIFGDTVSRGPRGEYLFRWPEAREAWERNTDTTRARPEHLERPAPAVAPTHAAAGDRLITAFYVDLHAKVTALCGELDDIDREQLEDVFATAHRAALAGAAVEGPFAPEFDPAYVAEVCR